MEEDMVATVEGATEVTEATATDFTVKLYP